MTYECILTETVGAGGSQSVAWQFASRSREAPLRLVAVRGEASVRLADGSSRRTVSNTNLVSGERVDVSDDVVRGRKSRHEQKARLPVRSPIALEAFAFDPAAFGEDARDAKPEASVASGRLSGS